MTMSFIRPMFAAKIKDGFNPSSFDLIAEEKYDGIRILAIVDRETPEDLLTDCTVKTFSRNGIHHAVPKHLREDLRRLPTGVYDMEMYVPLLRSFGATTKAHESKYRLAVFDVLKLYDCDGVITDTTDMPLRDRRSLLVEMFSRPEVASETMKLANWRAVKTMEDIVRFRDEVWGVDGEGLILKNLDAIYRPGSRRQGVWWKIKKLRSALLTVVGFEPSKGEVYDRGPYARTILEDASGVRTSVKTRTDEDCRKFEQEANNRGAAHHPAIGRKLWIEYQEKTPDGSYRHPMWDRWATKTEETDAELGEYTAGGDL